MIITNDSGLPEALVRALKNDPYNSGDSDFTATGLLKPARISALEFKFKDQLTEDAEDGLYRLYGQVCHGILERANMADMAEKRFYAVINVSGKDYKISAQMDTLSVSNKTLSDFKFTTSWGFKSDKPAKPEWVAQLNIQLELMRQNNMDAKAIQIIGLLRDWQQNEAKRDPNYPQRPIAIMPIEMWSRERTVAFIKTRIEEHVNAKVNLPECTPDEKWQKPGMWAVTKRGQKRAINGGLQFSEEAATKVAELNPGTIINFRKGEDVRCANYCPVSQFCDVYQNSLKEGVE